MDAKTQNLVSQAFYTAPADIVKQMRELEAELDSIYTKLRKSTDTAEKDELKQRQTELESSMELMTQLLCFAKKV